MNATVVTPWYDHQELWEDYSRALELGPQPDETLVVDNGSAPPLPFARIRNRENLGFCRASNQGLEQASGEVVVFLNNDVWASEHGWLQELVDEVEPGVLAGARVRVEPHATVDGNTLPYLDGWCIAGMRLELLELGGFDQTLTEPAYYSDNLLCLEARAHGMTLRWADVGVAHKGNRTARPDDPRTRAATITNRLVYERRARELLTTTKGKT